MKLGLGIQSEHLVKFNSIANTRRLTSVVPCLFLIHLQYISLRCSVLLWAPLTALRTTFLCDFTSLYVTALHAVTWRSSYGDSQLSVCQSVSRRDEHGVTSRCVNNANYSVFARWHQCRSCCCCCCCCGVLTACTSACCVAGRRLVCGSSPVWMADCWCWRCVSLCIEAMMVKGLIRFNYRARAASVVSKSMKVWMHSALLYESVFSLSGLAFAVWRNTAPAPHIGIFAIYSCRVPMHYWNCPNPNHSHAFLDVLTDIRCVSSVVHTVNERIVE